MLEELHQPTVVDGVEEATDVGIEHPLHLLRRDRRGEGVQRIVLAASRPEPVRETEKVLFVDRVHHLDHRSLDDLVFHRGDSERALPPVGLGNEHSSRGLRSVRPLMHSAMKLAEIVLELLAVMLPRNTVDARRGAPGQSPVRVAKTIDGDVVQERRELRFPVLSCSLTHTGELTWRG